MSIGLDLGATQFRSLRRQGNRLIGRTCRLDYTAIPDSAPHRRLLDRDGIAYAECDGALMLLGDAASEWGRLLRTPVTPLLPDGQLPANDLLARQILSLMIDAVLPPASHPDEICCLTVPGELLPQTDGIERAFFQRLIALRGYRTTVIGQGRAVVLAELGDAAFTGIGISLGAALCEFSLVRCGQELGRCAIPWGTSELSALNVEEGGATATSKVDQLVVDFLVEVLLEAGLRIGQADGFRLLTQPVTLACAGGVTARPGFEQLWQQAWRRAAWPLSIGAMRIATDSTYTIARGCLIQAKLEARPAALHRAAA